MKILFMFVCIVAISAAINSVAEKRDAAVIRTASLYEQCVKTEYGMTPIRYYEEHHKYPVCGN